MGYRQSEAAPIGDGYLNPRKCPVCGKTFIPAPMHSYHKNEDEAEPLVCTWKCARAGQGYERTRRKHVMKTDRRPKRKRYVYTVVNTQTGETVCRDALIRQAAAALGKTEAAFYAMCTLANKGQLRRWTVEKKSVEIDIGEE